MTLLHEILEPNSIICSKLLISLVFDKSVTDRPTSGPTDGRTDRPGYRDVKTHLKRGERPCVEMIMMIAQTNYLDYFGAGGTTHNILVLEVPQK